MQDKENCIKTLAELGVNKTQAKIFLALVENGTSTIRTISNYSGVGRPETYRAILQLKTNGLIETILCTPTKYKAIPLCDAISILMDQKNKKIIELKEKSEELLKEFAKKPNEITDAEDDTFILVPRGQNSINKNKEAIVKSKKKIDFITSAKSFNQTLLSASDEINEAVNRGVIVRFILDKNTRNKTLTKIFTDLCKNTRCQIKYVPHLPQAFIAIYDKKEIQMATSEEGDLNQTPILWSNNSVLVKVIQDYFETTWSCTLDKPRLKENKDTNSYLKTQLIQ
ncbi:MAG: helix-turn-helix domain-containing protein [Thermoproteota archaeon]|nr:helix-turn-helix domain-containing protein [Thermoproteota archaeon]NLD65241.1 TrmB family transcriptional regulator [Thermoproteota archaeon]